jgi:hypothetical protein
MSNKNAAPSPSSRLADDRDAHYKERLADCLKVLGKPILPLVNPITRPLTSLESRDGHIAEVAEFITVLSKKSKAKTPKVLKPKKAGVKKPKWEDLTTEERDRLVAARYEKAGFKVVDAARTEAKKGLE